MYIRSQYISEEIPAKQEPPLNEILPYDLTIDQLRELANKLRMENNLTRLPPLDEIPHDLTIDQLIELTNKLRMENILMGLETVVTPDIGIITASTISGVTYFATILTFFWCLHNF